MQLSVRRLASLAAIAAVALAAAGVSHAGSPPEIYNEFARDGKLSCSHSRADLAAALRSGTINQYGDPYTLARLRLAIRKQLAGGCSRQAAAGAQPSEQPGGEPAEGSGAEEDGGDGSGGAKGKRGSGGGPTPPGRPDATPPESGSSTPAATSGGAFVGRQGLVLAAFVLVVAIGGWLSKRAVTARD